LVYWSIGIIAHSIWVALEYSYECMKILDTSRNDDYLNRRFVMRARFAERLRYEVQDLAMCTNQ